MFKKLTLSAFTALALGAGGAMAAGDTGHMHDVDFSFEGPFGTYDQNQLQRGLQIYTEVCSACHGLQHVPIRTLADEGGPHLPEDQVRAYAGQFDIYDAELDDDRPRIPADHFPTSSDSTIPDLSLMAKARAGFHGPMGTGMSQLFNGIGGPEYIVSILTGYVDAPACAPEDFPGYYNQAFAPGGYPDECKDEHGAHTTSGSWIAMAQPLYGEDVEFADEHSNELHHEAEDVASFLMWTAEPKMMARKQAGFVAVTFLFLLTVLLYLTNKKLWAPHKGKKFDL
ncbi:cytochrome c1 [Pacificibacter sp. AS14]|uniref:cytochrome c1 n=1 Tax=Pacificibacter sp. AS14 TaxID=3135785 RepID=UPI003171865B